jgi:sulfite reductase alpha subunit-like flavoprotein
MTQQETATLAQKRRMASMPLVASGSAGGTAMKLARIVATFMGSASTNMNTVSLNRMTKPKIAIFIVSTIGDGEYPLNARGT